MVCKSEMKPVKVYVTRERLFTITKSKIGHSQAVIWEGLTSEIRGRDCLDSENSTYQEKAVTLL
jgi:hypothetical protein